MLSTLRRALTAAPLALFPLAASAQELPRDAAKLYAQLCASCHGENLAGGAGLNLLDGPWKQGGDHAEALAKAISEGRLDKGMPGFGAVLDAPRVRALSVFIQERAVQARERGEAPPRPKIGAETVRTRAASFRVETVAEGLEVPWEIAFLPGSEGLLVAERRGTLRRVRAGKVAEAAIEGTPRVWAQGQGGLLAVAPHPDYAKNGWIYLAFSDPGAKSGEAMTAVVRGRIRDDKWTDEQEIYRAPAGLYRGAGVHFGTRLVFADGYLFFGIGDRGAQDQAQDLRRPNGKIHRVHDDGRAPADNPFVKTPGALPTIWSYGHRNPQGIVARPGTRGDAIELWESEHGPRGGDELNLVKRGLNYGWPLVTFGMNYNGTPVSADTAREGLEPPAWHWTPSIAACGLDVYAGEKFPGWRGDLLAGSLRQEELRRLKLDGAKVVEEETLFRGLGRVRTVRTGPDGLVYAGLENPGRIVRLVPAE